MNAPNRAEPQAHTIHRARQRLPEPRSYRFFSHDFCVAFNPLTKPSMSRSNDSNSVLKDSNLRMVEVFDGIQRRRD